MKIWEKILNIYQTQGKDKANQLLNDLIKFFGIETKHTIKQTDKRAWRINLKIPIEDINTGKILIHDVKVDIDLWNNIKLDDWYNRIRGWKNLSSYWAFEYLNEEVEELY